MVRPSLRTAACVAALTAVAATPAAAAPFPGGPQYLKDLRPGQARIIVGPDATRWEAYADRADVRAIVVARVTPGRVGVWIETQPRTRPCAATPDRNVGRSLLRPLSIVTTDRRGWLMEDAPLLLRERAVRICAWVSRPGPRTASARTTVVVEPVGAVAAGAIVAGGSLVTPSSVPGPRGVARSRIVSTVPGTYSYGDGPEPVTPGCRPPRVDDLRGAPGLTYQTFLGRATSGPVGDDPCAEFGTLAANFAEPRVPPVVLPLSRQTMFGASPGQVIQHTGNACTPDAVTNGQLTAEEAVRALEKVGCVPGETLVIAPPTGVRPKRGEAYATVINGAHVLLAPLGTRVDVVVAPG